MWAAGPSARWRRARLSHNEGTLTRAHLESRLKAGSTGERGDHDLNPGWSRDTLGIPAAVLIPLVERDVGLTVMLTQRTSQLTNHAGQISFPGGRVEPNDATLEATALRETHEEVGLSADRISIVGRLDRYATRTGFDITPWVGFVTPPFTLAIDTREVDNVFEVPLAFVLDRTNYQRHKRRFAGALRTYYALPYADRYIWGATAGMLMNLHQVVCA